MELVQAGDVGNGSGRSGDNRQYGGPAGADLGTPFLVGDRKVLTHNGAKVAGKNDVSGVQRGNALVDANTSAGGGVLLQAGGGEGRGRLRPQNQEKRGVEAEEEEKREGEKQLLFECSGVATF